MEQKITNGKLVMHVFIAKKENWLIDDTIKERSQDANSIEF